MGKTIEALKIGRDAAWSIVQESDQLIFRRFAAVCAINSHEIVVYGGFDYGEPLNDGYVFDTQTHQVRQILGKESDMAFRCFSQNQWHGNNKYVTLGLDDDWVLHLVQSHMEHASYSEVRSLADLGHCR